ncbi:hypothetical protein [Lactobacillus sp.]|uniref:hypothetical protein n=1 Tax=Lactobacillus sp. TaxID=1591 RepID=UPI0019B3945A|nr:hypothetical protein [Lactobacillus sp.]MBD5430490.1 hypothetical protein [Lactobacillus sp.]MBD5430784.1 hypothetical protein [Lactobacillus sp.]
MGWSTEKTRAYYQEYNRKKKEEEAKVQKAATSGNTEAIKKLQEIEKKKAETRSYNAQFQRNKYNRLKKEASQNNKEAQKELAKIYKSKNANKLKEHQEKCIATVLKAFNTKTLTDKQFSELLTAAIENADSKQLVMISDWMQKAKRKVTVDKEGEIENNYQTLDRTDKMVQGRRVKAVIRYFTNFTLSNDQFHEILMTAIKNSGSKQLEVISKLLSQRQKD